MAHSLPGYPHAAAVFPGWHTLFSSQQPLGQLPMQVAAWHSCATQTPPEGHPTHAVPPLPQAFTDEPVWQVPVASQQPEQFVGPHGGGGAPHVPPLQTSPLGQVTQRFPDLPHSAVLVPESQFPLVSQQPLQVDALHVGFWQ